MFRGLGGRALGDFLASRSGENREQRFEPGFVAGLCRAGRPALPALKKVLFCENRRADDTDHEACRISNQARSVGRSFCVDQPASTEPV